jgi:formyl-CoA transferase
MLGDAGLAADPRFATVADRVKIRPETDGKVAAAFATMDVATLSAKLAAADIAFGRVNDVAGLIRHPHLRRIEVETPSGPVSYPAPAPIRDQARSYGHVPKLGEHTDKVRKEFS